MSVEAWLALFDFPMAPFLLFVVVLLRASFFHGSDSFFVFVACVLFVCLVVCFRIYNMFMCFILFANCFLCLLFVCVCCPLPFFYLPAAFILFFLFFISVGCSIVFVLFFLFLIFIFQCVLVFVSVFCPLLIVLCLFLIFFVFVAMCECVFFGSVFVYVCCVFCMFSCLEKAISNETCRFFIYKYAFIKQ